MIRRWSHLNIFNNISNQNLSKLYKKSKLVLFKANVKYKHFRKFKLLFKTTKRRAYRHLKHRSTFLVFSNIFKFWTIDYKNYINISKFEYTFNIYSFNYLIYNSNFLKNNNPDLHYNTNFLFSSLTIRRNAMLLPIQKNFNIKYKELSTKNNSISLIWHNETKDDLTWLNETNLYFLLFINFDSQYVPASYDITKLNFNYQIIFSTLFLIFLKKIFSYYSLFVFFFYTKTSFNTYNENFNRSLN